MRDPVLYHIIFFFNYKSDVYYQLQDQSILLIENNKYHQTLNLSWSSSGSTDISFSIVGDFGSRAPDWVSVNSTSGGTDFSNSWCGLRHRLLF